jgi:Mg-chelatase subunit ChlD
LDKSLEGEFRLAVSDDGIDHYVTTNNARMTNAFADALADSGPAASWPLYATANSTGAKSEAYDIVGGFNGAYATNSVKFAGDLNGGVLPNAATANAWSEVAQVITPPAAVGFVNIETNATWSAVEPVFTPPAADRAASREAFVNSGTINSGSLDEIATDLKLDRVPVPGHLSLTGGAIGAQAGTAPSYTGTPGYANPSGIFPGATPLPGTNSLASATENAGKVVVNYAVASPPAPVVAPAAPAATNGALERRRRALAANVAVSTAAVEGGLLPTNTPPPPAMRPAPAIRNPQSAIRNPDATPPKPAVPPPVPQPEVQTRDNAYSTFSLNVSDVSFKLAAASLQNGVMPDAATVRSEEFINAFDYRDSEPVTGAPIGFSSERAGYPFAHNRDLLRFAVKAAAEGRQAGRPLNLVLLLDKSGSMERADRVAIIREALRVLATQLKPQDTISVVVFARTARLFADGVPGSQFGALAAELEAITPEGGTNLEEAMRLAYETALRHYLANGENRVVVLTDGAANLGNVEPDALKKRVEANRAQGIALDCFGVGWEDYNDTLLETLSRSGGGRYGFVNTPEEAATGFAGQLAGALRVAASDVKVQVEFNPDRVISWRQIGYAKDQLTQEQFRDNSVKAAQISVAESGNALYTVELNPAGDGPVCVVYVRYRAPGTSDYYERAWAVPCTSAAETLDKASPAMRLAATAGAFSEWLAGSPYAGEVTLNQLQGYLRGVPEFYGADTRPAQLETMLREARSISGK